VSRIQRNCEAFSKICVTATNTEIKYRDTTIYVTKDIGIALPKDTAIINNSVTVNSLGAQMNLVVSKKGIITVSSFIHNSKLVTTGYVNKDSIIKSVQDSILLKNALVNKSSQSTIIVKDKYIPIVYKYAFWILIAEIILLLIIVVLKLSSFSPVSIISKFISK